MASFSADIGHPLALRLIEMFGDGKLSGTVLEIAAGSGRNTRALIEAGIKVLSTADSDPITQLPGGRETFAAALSTHGLLHGETAKLKLAVAELRRVLEPGAVVLVTLGSIADARYGFGIPFDERTFAAGDGEEAGIPHAFFDRDGVKELFSHGFRLESLEDANADETAGAWAHGDLPTGRRHWFVQARREDERVPETR